MGQWLRSSGTGNNKPQMLGTGEHSPQSHSLWSPDLGASPLVCASCCPQNHLKSRASLLPWPSLKPLTPGQGPAPPRPSPWFPKCAAHTFSFGQRGFLKDPQTVLRPLPVLSLDLTLCPLTEGILSSSSSWATFPGLPPRENLPQELPAFRTCPGFKASCCPGSFSL